MPFDDSSTANMFMHKFLQDAHVANWDLYLEAAYLQASSHELCGHPCCQHLQQAVIAVYNTSKP